MHITLNTFLLKAARYYESKSKLPPQHQIENMDSAAMVPELIPTKEPIYDVCMWRPGI